MSNTMDGTCSKDGICAHPRGLTDDQRKTQDVYVCDELTDVKF
jgi:hypothetical protein